VHNDKLADLEAQANALEAQIKALENSQWHKTLEADANAALKNAQFA
jgi:hypothetical protein